MLEDSPIISLLWMVISVVVVIGLAYWVTRYIARRGAFGAFGPMGTGEGLELLAQLPLGKDQRVVVTRAGERCFLLGVTAAEITLLAELTEEEAVLWRNRAETAKKRETPSFREALDTVLRQKGRR